MNTPTDTQVQGTISREISWAQHHLFTTGLCAVVIIGGLFLIENVIAKRAHDARVADQAIFVQMQKQNEQTQAASKATIDALTQQNAQITQQFQMAMAAMASRDAQLLKDRAEIKTLPPSQLATKWGAAANEPAPTINTNGNFDTPLTLAQKSTDALIQVPVLSKDISTLQSSLALSQQTATNNEGKYESEKKAHDSDNATCTQNVKTLNDKITEVKDNARKDNIIFLVIGWIARTVVGSKI